MNESAESATGSPIRTSLAEVRYSLPELLEELKLERTASTFSMEKLDHQEIGKLFKARNTRGKSKK
jgi:hypothetical protein